MGLDVEVKDASRFPDKWAYFGFDASQKSSTAMSPGQNACWNVTIKMPRWNIALCSSIRHY